MFRFQPEDVVLIRVFVNPTSTPGGCSEVGERTRARTLVRVVKTEINFKVL